MWTTTCLRQTRQGRFGSLRIDSPHHRPVDMLRSMKQEISKGPPEYLNQGETYIARAAIKKVAKMGRNMSFETPQTCLRLKERCALSCFPKRMKRNGLWKRGAPFRLPPSENDEERALRLSTGTAVRILFSPYGRSVRPGTGTRFSPLPPHAQPGPFAPSRARDEAGL